MSWIWLLVATLGAGFLGLTVASSGVVAVAGGLGLAEPTTVEVTSTTFVERTPIGRGSGCDFHRLDVAWDDREAAFTVCENQPLAELRPGDQVAVWSAPWSDEVVPDEWGASIWSFFGLVLGAWMLGQGLVSARRHRRLRQPGDGEPFAVRVNRVGRSSVGAVPEPADADQRPWTLLPAVPRAPVAEGDRGTLWSSRRGWTGRPRGPWVLETRGRTSAFTHAWRRRG